HRFNPGFERSGQYRWSLSMDIGSNNFATDHYQYDPSFAWGPSDYDVTHALKVFGVWAPTIFKDSDSWAERLIGGWTISGILNATSGFPWTPVYNNIGCGVVYAESGSNGGGGDCGFWPGGSLVGGGEDHTTETLIAP